MKTWFISDTHFRHSNILTFRDKDGELIRPGFDNVDHMNEFMIQAWNDVVAPGDKVYHLGDVTMGSSVKAFEMLGRLNGRKVLIKGNHDNAKIQRYLDHFTDVRSEIHKKTQDGDIVVFTHRPIRMEGASDANIFHFNVHGHIHQNTIEDSKYINVCVEHLYDYQPISWDEIQEEIKRRKGEM